MTTEHNVDDKHEDETKTLQVDTIYNGDCLELMNYITQNSIDLILTDPPYGISRNRWDTVVPFDVLWSRFERIVKDHTPIAIFGIPPFSSATIMSKPEWFRYSWVWDKRAPVGFLNANRAPLRRYEMISVFSKKAPTYYPQKTKGKAYSRNRTITADTTNYGKHDIISTKSDGMRYPTDVIDQFPNLRGSRKHPTRKSIELIEYLIKTYTLPGDIVLDPFLGSGTTAIACIRTGRKYIGIEKEECYYDIAVEEIAKERQKMKYDRTAINIEKEPQMACINQEPPGGGNQRHRQGDTTCGKESPSSWF